MDPIQSLVNLGQSIWYDNIQRSQLMDGSLKKLIDAGWIKGVTSNPSIFQKSISTSNTYDETLKPMAWSGLDSEEIFWQLAVEDIQKTADLLLPTYEVTDRADGFVSLEVSPLLAHDTNKTLEQARILWARVARPNLMIKIPATLAGIPAVREAISSGINVNVTLIFSLKRYSAVMDAFLSGLEERIQRGEQIDHIASVASFFVSRVDTKIDGYLMDYLKGGKITSVQYDDMSGKAAVANARLAYRLYEQVIKSERYLKLVQHGARMQRPLWASTSTKNPQYRDVVYVEELIGKDTVNTVPPATLDAFAQHGEARETIHNDLQLAERIFSDLDQVGISIDAVTDELEKEGVTAFTDSFIALLNAINSRQGAAVRELGTLAPGVEQEVARLKVSSFIQRFFDKDATLWTTVDSEKQEIQNRMNWVNAPVANRSMLPGLHALLRECNEKGFKKVVLLGMGGSSLAPEVYRLVHGIGTQDGMAGLDLCILDSTDPDQLRIVKDCSPVATTLFIVASKSGSTGEINAFFEFFWDIAKNELGKRAGDHFVVITDPNSPLEKKARERGFWKVFHGDPQVGGRYSALTAFGLVPAALIGMNVEKLLDRAAWLANRCKPEQTLEANPGVVLGAYIGFNAVNDKNKLTILTDPDWSPFGNWLEQLIAESSGKIGKGIVPIVNEPELPASEYTQERVFVYLRSNGERENFAEQLLGAGHAVLKMDVNDVYELGAQFYLWEVATPVACSILGVNVFDQPDVQDAKTRTLQGLADYKQSGKLIEPEPSLEVENARIYSSSPLNKGNLKTLNEVAIDFLDSNIRERDYIGINAFLPMTDYNEGKLAEFRKILLRRYKMTTTLGFGPRFLHSTGQLHKGGPDEGIFIVITARRTQDIEIPGEGVSFGVMQRAQALGDMAALKSRNRRMLWIDLPNPDADLLL